jgi:hypothetical protein
VRRLCVHAKRIIERRSVSDHLNKGKVGSGGKRRRPGGQNQKKKKGGNGNSYKRKPAKTTQTHCNDANTKKDRKKAERCMCGTQDTS